MIEDFVVVRGQSEGSAAGMRRRDIAVGDIVVRKGTKDYRLVSSDKQMRDFYRACGIEIWGDWRWTG